MRVGIDIGTTYSCISYLNREGKTVIINDVETKLQTTPSVVHLGKNRCLIGYSALDKLTVDPEAVLCWLFKRQIGQSEIITYDQNQNGWTPEALTALIIKKLLNDAEQKLGKKVTGATITVPVHFDNRQRSALIHSAEMASLDKVEILDEPVAAAIHYGLSKIRDKAEKRILVFDLGGGTFDVTVLLLNEKGFYTLASHGDTTIGGKEVDEIIMNMISEYLESRNISIVWDTYNNQLLRKAAEKIKIDLSSHSQDYKANIFLSGWSGSVTIDIKKYEEH